MPDMPTSALIRRYRVEHRMNTISLAPHTEVSLPIDLLSLSGDVLPAATTVWRSAQ